MEHRERRERRGTPGAPGAVAVADPKAESPSLAHHLSPCSDEHCCTRTERPIYGKTKKPGRHQHAHTFKPRVSVFATNFAQRHDGDCGLRQHQARSSGSISSSGQTKSVAGQSPLPFPALPSFSTLPTGNIFADWPVVTHSGRP
jgi:hypothetical protein